MDDSASSKPDSERVSGIDHADLAAFHQFMQAMAEQLVGAFFKRCNLAGLAQANAFGHKLGDKLKIFRAL